MVRVGIDTQRAGVLGKVHISVGGGDSHSESRGPGERLWFWSVWG